MSKPKLLLAYAALNERERQQFGEFVRSPFHNTREKLVRLVLVLEEMHATEEPADWDKEMAYTRIFDQSGFHELQLNNVVSDLFQLLETFLAWQQFSKQEGLRDVYMMEYLLSTSMIEQADKVIRKKLEQPEADAYIRYRINLLADQFFFQRSRKNENTWLLAGQESLELHFLSNQLRIWCELVSRSNILSLQYDEERFLAFEQYLQTQMPKYGDYHTISIYTPILQWLRDQENDSWFDGFQEKLFAHIQEFPDQEAKDIIAYVQNYCVKRINQGKSEFLRAWLDIARFVLPLQYLHEGQYISQWTFKNIVTTGVRLKEFEWTETFVHTHYEQLPPEMRDNAYQYNLAVLYYEQQQYSRAMQLLNRVHFTDPNYYLDAKTILLKIYYDQNAFEALLSLHDTVKIYLLRDKLLSRSQQMLYKNLFAFTLKLYKLRLEKDSTDPEKWKKQHTELKQKIEANNLIANKSWLADRVSG